MSVFLPTNTQQYYTGLFTRGVFLNFFLRQPIMHIVTGGRPRRRGGVPRGRSAKGAERQGGEAPRGGAKRQGAKRHGTMESSRGHRASRSDDGGELERSDEGWLDDGASAGAPC
jgi:hypothetical protein